MSSIQKSGDTGYALRHFTLYAVSAAHARHLPVINVGKVVDKV
jgi:hypothetical protein